jgi:Protein of unknown function (DUF2958)
MKLITKEIEQEFIKQGHTSQKSAKDIKIILKLFGGGSASWYLYEKEDDDTYIGFVNLGDAEMSECGRVSLSELKNIRFQFGLGIERDMYFGFNHTLKDVMETVQSGGHV